MKLSELREELEEIEKNVEGDPRVMVSKGLYKQKESPVIAGCSTREDHLSDDLDVVLHGAEV